jgi:multisubunit Na+/H+ antiporter MnhG subunit
MRRGEPLTDVRLVGPALLGSLARDGLVAAPVRIADAGASRLLKPGDIVDVLAANDRDTRASAPVLAHGVRVITVPAAEDAAGGLDSGALVVLATTPATAALLARAAVTARLSVTISAR